MKKIGDFEANLENIDMIIEKLESGELSLENSIKEYEKAMKLIKSSSEILDRVEGKIIKVSENNEEITFEEGDV
ncbi:exodeoxyribonuclease VII small subunit [Fusobacterium sp.]|uniref:exodeoxyribonuclease VII small subunit n=1 Tax=Fusobacterium sp. TaxID=68766 RepID=UPI00261DA228|nr:exodeoxyribonuclease VII small subunit [Fusobacterium sp.]